MKKQAFVFILFFIISSFANSQGEYLWTRTISVSNDHNVKDVVVDDNGNTYISGYCSGVMLDHNYEVTYVCSESKFLMKLNTNGHIIWTRFFTGDYFGMSDNITLDNEANVYITGYFKDKLEVDSIVIDSTQNPDIQQLYVMKFDSTGTLSWSFSPVSDEEAFAFDIECDESQNCYVTGRFTGNLTIGDTILSQAYLAYADESALLFKLDSDANVIWAQNWKGYNKYSSTVSDTLHTGLDQICKAENGNFYVTGTFNKLLIIDDYDTIPTVGGGTNGNAYQDIIVGKIDASGNIIWLCTFGFDSPSVGGGEVNATHIIANDRDELFVFGDFYTSGPRYLVIDSFSVTNSWGYDYYYTKFYSDGTCAWLRSMRGLNNGDYPHDLVLDRKGNPHISAEMSQTNLFINDTVSCLQCSWPGLLEFNPTNGYLNEYISPYPFSTVDPYPYNGYFPRIYFDNYGNKYIYAVGKNYYDETNPYGYFKGIHLAKMSSGDVYLEGVVYNDANQNAVHDSLEEVIPDNIVIFDTGAYFRTTDTSGKYYVLEDYSHHFVEAVTPKYWEPTTPLDPHWYYLDTLEIDDTIRDLNFGFHMIPDITDLRIDITSLPCVPGFETSIILTAENIGTKLITDGSIQLIYDNTLVFESSSDSGFVHINNELIWQFDSLDIGQRNSIGINFTVPADTALLGDTLFHTASIFPVLPDTNQIDNFDTVQPVIVGSYDPNCKEVYPSGYGNDGFINENDTTLEYTIYFQNVGTYHAENIMVIDSLGSNLDIYTFEMISSSHKYEYQGYGSRVICWTFDSIMLPDSGTNLLGSNGFIKYRINTKPNRQPGISYLNKAHIYFDYNPPIITNEVINTIYDCETMVFNVDEFNCFEDTVDGYAEVDEISNVNWMLGTDIISNNDTLLWYPDTSGVFNLQLRIYNEVCSRDTLLEVTVYTLNEVIDTSLLMFEGDSVLVYGNYISEPGIYYDTLVDLNGCDSIVSTTVEFDYSSVAEYSGIECSIFPNPNQGIFTITRSEASNESIKIRIFDINMRLILTREMPGNQYSMKFDVSNLEKGQYFIDIKSNGLNSVKRVILQ